MRFFSKVGERAESCTEKVFSVYCLIKYLFH